MELLQAMLSAHPDAAKHAGHDGYKRKAALAAAVAAAGLFLNQHSGARPKFNFFWWYRDWGPCGMCFLLAFRHPVLWL